MASQLAEREDALLCSDVRNKLFGPMEFSRRDLGALNIMRGRDTGLPDYNSARRSFGLKPITDWKQINEELWKRRPDVFENLMEIYQGRLDNIDVYLGGMLESKEGPGELFSVVIKEQFTRIRDADRFWFENLDNGMFTESEVEGIRNTKMHDVILATLEKEVSEDEIQKNVFLFHDGDPCPQPGQLSAATLPPCNFLVGFDYFSDSEVPYIYGCFLLAFIPIVAAGVGYGVVKLQNSKRRRLKARHEENNNGKSVDKMVVKEWLHLNHKRLVKVKFGPEQAFYTLNRKGEKLRTVNFKSVDVLTVEVTHDPRKKPMLLVRVPRDYDLVLEFDSSASRKKFLNKLEHFLTGQKKHLEQVPTFRDQMLANAETRERREKRLEHFFREAYALTFGLKPGEKRKLEDVTGDVIMVMRTSLSRNEFASALGMKGDDVFVKMMFNIVDKDGDGRISFQEFLDTVVLFSKGKTEDKLRIIFDMCDNDRNGVIDKGELSEMLRSLVEIARTNNSLSNTQVTELIDGMFQSAGLQHKDSLHYDDFKLMMKEYRGDFIAIGLDCKGAKQNFLDTSTNVARMTSFHIDAVQERHRNSLLRRLDGITTFLEENRQNIFYLFVFYVITIALFIERFIHYSFMAEHTDLRHIMGVGIAITRGSANALSFCYSLLLLTMSRNLLTKLKEFSIQQYIPLDAHIPFHKICALTALFFSLMHTVGHIVNFYHVSTQPMEHLRCLSKEINLPSDFKPTITYWLFGTLTGLTGLLLFVVVIIIFVFAHPTIRKKAYNFFWMAHSLYIVLYILTIIHGLGRLTSEPRFWMFVIGPAIVYALDKVFFF